MPVMQGRLAAAAVATAAASWAIAKILNWRRERKERLGGLSRRSTGLVGGSPPCYIAEHIQRLITGDVYHPKRSPDGYICLAVSENRYAKMAVPLARLSLTSPPLGLSTSQPWAICGRLSFPLLQRPLRESRPADITTTGYDDPRGGHEFRGRVATLLTSHFRRPIDAAHLYCCAGATGVLSVLFFVLCDRGDGVLIPAPYFTGRAAASRAAPVAPRARAPRAHCLLARRRRAGFDGDLSDPRIGAVPVPFPTEASLGAVSAPAGIWDIDACAPAPRCAGLRPLPRAPRAPEPGPPQIHGAPQRAVGGVARRSLRCSAQARRPAARAAAHEPPQPDGSLLHPRRPPCRRRLGRAQRPPGTPPRRAGPSGSCLHGR